MPGYTSSEMLRQLFGIWKRNRILRDWHSWPKYASYVMYTIWPSGGKYPCHQRWRRVTSLMSLSICPGCKAPSWHETCCCSNYSVMQDCDCRCCRVWWVLSLAAGWRPGEQETQTDCTLVTSRQRPGPARPGLAGVICSSLSLAQPRLSPRH